ncbi:hypothetical protein ScPMuIL_004103 [Solemya velum]
MAVDGLFQDLTAWFSTSVRRRRVRLWREGGGQVVGLEEAQFVFSEDAESPDTIRIFESEPYFSEYLAVFHANYISACVGAGDTKRVTLGKYFLPPQQVAELIRSQMTFPWESGNKSGSSTSDEEVQPASKKSLRAKKNKTVLTRNRTSPHTTSINTQTQPSRKPKTNVRATDTAQESRMEISNTNSHEADQSQSGSNIKLRSQNLRSNEQQRSNNDLQNKNKNAGLDQNIPPKKNSVFHYKEHQGVRGSQHEGIVRIDDLPKVIGTLEDLDPGVNGFSVFLKTGEVIM